MNRVVFCLLIGLIQLISCNTIEFNNEVYSSEKLSIKQISEHAYIHISQLDIPNYGKFDCNGLIYFKNNEAIVFDTPTDDSTSAELINWLVTEQQQKIKAVVATHFHVDCLGGLAEFHKNNIPSYASQSTIELAEANKYNLPQISFERELELKIGGEKTITKFYGEGHTPDNIVGFIPSEKVLFGGCLIKSVEAGKGNLEDANLKEWAKTVRKIRGMIPSKTIIVPGHGAHGKRELLDYTISLFQTEKNNPNQ